ncbi:hypothetical protein GCM10010916_41490 [Paenibacillus abyssi]|uniref:Uncharacterized protein n=1 Tax=Paenibacillus abyssi TaxID=1340531 RepID=A0A917G3C7_9BACL|nr:hypothetical protein GCM10010916_41490 [Paenibacillus abyssi]
MSRPGVACAKQCMLPIQAGHSRYLFECRMRQDDVVVFFVRNKGGTTEAEAFRPLGREAFLYFID